MFTRRTNGSNIFGIYLVLVSTKCPWRHADIWYFGNHVHAWSLVFHYERAGTRDTAVQVRQDPSSACGNSSAVFHTQ